MSEETKPVKEKKGLRIRVSTMFILLFLLIIIALGAICYYLFMEKENAVNDFNIVNGQLDELKTSVNDLKTSVEKMDESIKNINTSAPAASTPTAKPSTDVSSTPSTPAPTTPAPSTEKPVEEVKDIKLNGVYSIQKSDGSYEFKSNGEVSLSGDVTKLTGTYKTTAANTIEIHFTKKETFEQDPVAAANAQPGEPIPMISKESSVDETITGKVIDAKTIEIKEKTNTYKITKIEN